MPKSDIRVQVKSISSVDGIKDLFEEVGVTMIVQVVVLQNRAEVISDRCFKEISKNHHVSQGAVKVSLWSSFIFMVSIKLYLFT